MNIKIVDRLLSNNSRIEFVKCVNLIKNEHKYLKLGSMLNVALVKAGLPGKFTNNLIDDGTIKDEDIDALLNEVDRCNNAVLLLRLKLLDLKNSLKAIEGADI